VAGTGAKDIARSKTGRRRRSFFKGIAFTEWSRWVVIVKGVHGAPLKERHDLYFQALAR
jgi:hypothetical protein